MFNMISAPARQWLVRDSRIASVLLLELLRTGRLIERFSPISLISQPLFIITSVSDYDLKKVSGK